MRIHFASIVGVTVALAISGCSCGKETTAKTRVQQDQEPAPPIEPAPRSRQMGAAAPGEVPKPPEREGPCDCPSGEYCALSMKPVKGGYPSYVHRCVSVPDDCSSCKCLDIDPCWEPMICGALVQDGRQVLCNNPKIRRTN